MRERFRRRSYVATSICVALLTIAAITSAKLAGLRWNHSESAPSGIWLVAVQQSPARGDYVEFCPRPFFAELFRARRYLSAGPCPGSTQTMLKQVAAIPGDVISIADDGVTVNGQALPGTAVKHEDRAGRPLSPLTFVARRVLPGELWVVGNHSPFALDSRYFGAVSAGAVRGVASPIWVWD